MSAEEGKKKFISVDDSWVARTAQKLMTSKTRLLIFLVIIFGSMTMFMSVFGTYGTRLVQAHPDTVACVVLIALAYVLLAWIRGKVESWLGLNTWRTRRNRAVNNVLSAARSQRVAKGRQLLAALREKKKAQELAAETKGLDAQKEVDSSVRRRTETKKA